MNPVFEKFPDVLFSSFRKQMLRGKVPADTVQRVFEPLLSNFYEIMLQLPPGLQIDFENIFRRYPDIAEGFGVRIKPSVIESLRCFARCRLEPDWGEPSTGGVKEGQGFFTTDRGSPVYIEFFYVEGEDFATFAYKPPRLDIEIHLCGMYTATLTPGRPNQSIPAESLFRVLMQCVREIDIRIVELP
ncbi:MAG: hypothetical protein ACP5SH_14785 [Syntrophobacteraceae bacterium]